MSSEKRLSGMAQFIAFLCALAWGTVAWHLVDFIQQFYFVYHEPDPLTAGLMEMVFYGIKLIAAFVGGAFGLSFGCFLAGARSQAEPAQEDAPLDE